MKFFTENGINYFVKAQEKRKAQASIKVPRKPSGFEAYIVARIRVCAFVVDIHIHGYQHVDR